MVLNFLKALSRREQWALQSIFAKLKALLAFKVPVKRIVATLVVIAELFGMMFFNMPVTPSGQELNLDGYDLVFYDEFTGTQLDTTKWQYRASGSRRGGFNSAEQVEVRDGKLTITGEYHDDGEFGAGWYAGMINLRQKYKHGYFEIKCICNKGKGFWSAFWIQADAPYTPEISRGGIGGAELDIFEAMDYGSLACHNSVSINIHCAGMGGDTSGVLNSCSLGNFKANDIYNEFNTYGLEWTEDEYIFYINGVEASRSTWADGVSQVEEQVIVSLEIPDELKFDHDFKTQFIVDYVKIYQK